MNDKKTPETDPEQSERFRKAVRDLDAAGELSPTADEDFDALAGRVLPNKEPPPRTPGER